MISSELRNSIPLALIGFMMYPFIRSYDEKFLESLKIPRYFKILIQVFWWGVVIMSISVILAFVAVIGYGLYITIPMYMY